MITIKKVKHLFDNLILPKEHHLKIASEKNHDYFSELMCVLTSLKNISSTFSN